MPLGGLWGSSGLVSAPSLPPNTCHDCLHKSQHKHLFSLTPGEGKKGSEMFLLILLCGAVEQRQEQQTKRAH